MFSLLWFGSQMYFSFTHFSYILHCLLLFIFFQICFLFLFQHFSIFSYYFCPKAFCSNVGIFHGFFVCVCWLLPFLWTNLFKKKKMSTKSYFVVVFFFSSKAVWILQITLTMLLCSTWKSSVTAMQFFQALISSCFGCFVCLFGFFEG